MLKNAYCADNSLFMDNKPTIFKKHSSNVMGEAK